MPGRLINAHSIFAIAVAAAKGINAPLRQGGKDSALISLVFAEASLEAFLNESIELASDNSHDAQEPQIVSSFAQLMPDFERSRLESKFQLAHWMLTGKPYEKSAQPYQDFLLLMRVRNTLLHYKPDPPLGIPGEEQLTVVGSTSNKVLDSLRSKNILADLQPGVQASWTAFVSTKAVGEWACNAASQMVLDFLSKLPPSSWESTLKFCYRAPFSVTF
ncbi:MAG TPA: hypothetical protein VOA64_09425 [Candidatus Dormibacteraeota bacterium]|nr:hypothetical protein [Candidatus Dormibacteraeota bacterium]